MLVNNSNAETSRSSLVLDRKPGCMLEIVGVCVCVCAYVHNYA